MSIKCKSYLLMHDSLEIAREIQGAVESVRNQRAAIEAEYQRQMETLQEQLRDQMKSGWSRLHMSLGIPLEEVGRWTLDASYLKEHNLAFLSQNEPNEDTGSLLDLWESMNATKQ